MAGDDIPAKPFVFRSELVARCLSLLDGILKNDPELASNLSMSRFRLSSIAEDRVPAIRAHHGASCDFPLMGALDLLNSALQPGDECIAPDVDRDGRVIGFKVVSCRRREVGCPYCGSRIHVSSPGVYSCLKCRKSVSVS